MTTLGAALNSSAQQLRVDAAVADPADYYKIDSEVVQLLSHRPLFHRVGLPLDLGVQVFLSGSLFR